MNKEECGFCGCVFSVGIQDTPGFREREEYYCPECNREFRVRASNVPRAVLFSKRTDGRTISYDDVPKIKQQISDLEKQLKDIRD